MMSLIFLALALLIPPPHPARRLAANRVRDGPDTPAQTSDVIDLFAAALSCGLSVPAAAAVVAEVSKQPEWQSAAALLALGVEPARAWEPVGSGDFVQLVTAQADSGASLVAGCQRLSHAAREEAQQQRIARAERAGVAIALPLTLFFLPAFFVLGMAPIVLSLGLTMFNF